MIGVLNLKLYGSLLTGDNMKKILLVLAVLLLSSCTTNYRNTEITFYSGRDTTVDASGASNTTDTGQAAQADLTPLLEAAKSVISGKTTSIIDQITETIEGGDIVEVE